MFNRYITAVQTAINAENGDTLSQLLHLNNADACTAILEARQRTLKWSPIQACQRLPQPWDDHLVCHARCVAEVQEGNHCEAYSAIVAGVQPFIKAFQEDRTAWMVPLMACFSRTLRAVAQAADVQLTQRGERAQKLEDCLDRLRKLFQAANQAAGNKRKKLATLDLVNVQFKIFFKLGNIRLCASLERAVSSPAFLPLEAFAVAHQITFNYYVGRLAIFDENYAKAVGTLTEALRHCPCDAHGNRKKLLKYLVPTQLLMGRLPKDSLLQDYGLHQYSTIVSAVRSGDVGALVDALEADQYRFIMEGIYLLLERLKFPTYRRLLKRVQLLHAAADPARAAQLPLGLFQRALSWRGVELEGDEVACIVANLIARGYVKGYISHKMQVVVLSKVAPFPPVQQLQQA